MKFLCSAYARTHYIQYPHGQTHTVHICMHCTHTNTHTHAYTHTHTHAHTHTHTLNC